MVLLLFFHEPRTGSKDESRGTVLECYQLWPCVHDQRFHPFKSEVWYKVMNSCENAVCNVPWIASIDGNNSTEFQISEYVSIISSFLGMKSTPGVFIYTGYRENRQWNTEKYIEGRDFSEVCGKMRGLFKSLYFTSLELSGFEILWCLVSVWDAKDFFRELTIRDRWMINMERWTQKRSGTLSF